MMKPSTTTMLAALLVAYCLASPSAAATPRRSLLDVYACEKRCKDTYEDNVKKCIGDTQLGQPPAIARDESLKAVSSVASAYKPPQKTGFELVEKECRKLQDPELYKCKSGCNKKPSWRPWVKDCAAVARKCEHSFKKGTMLAAWCRQEEGCYTT